MLKPKESFKCYGIKTRPAKHRQVLVIKKCVQDDYIDQNFSVNSYKNLLHSCNIDIMAKCGVDHKN